MSQTILKHPDFLLFLALSPLVAYFCCGWGLVYLFKSRWPEQWQGFTKGAPPKGLGLLTLFWLFLFVWMLYLEASFRLDGTPKPRWPPCNND